MDAPRSSPGSRFTDMQTLVVCERWTMPAAPATGAASREEQWFADWVRRSPRESSHHITAGWHAYSYLNSLLPAPVGQAMEFFGGLGCQSLMIKEMFRPQRHTIVERSPYAAAHLRSLMMDTDGVSVILDDAMNVDCPAGADIVGLDFGDLTATKATGVYRPLLDRAFAAGPQGVVLTDIAGQRLHLHRQRYGDLLDADCSTYPGYLDGLARHLLRTYGYQVARGFYHRWSSVLVVVPQERGLTTVLEPTPGAPVGLTLR